MTKTTKHTTNFADKSWGARFDTMGDISEAAFERNHEKWARYGLNRPDFPVARLPLATRYTPDYILEGRHFVEVQGCSPRAGIKLKIEKYVAIETAWHTVMPVLYFFWDSSRNMFVTVPLQDLNKLIKSDQTTLGTFKDPGIEKPYWQLKTNMFEWTHDGEEAGVA